MRLPAPAILTPALIVALSATAACGRTERASAEAVRAVRSRIEPRFQPPADGRLTDAQIEMYLRVRRASAGAGSDAEAARRLGASPAEFDWVRGRIVDALLALDSRQAAAAVIES